MAEKNVPPAISGIETEKSIDGIVENKNAENMSVGNESSAEKNDFSGAATVDPVEELLKNFSL